MQIGTVNLEHFKFMQNDHFETSECLVTHRQHLQLKSRTFLGTFLPIDLKVGIAYTQPTQKRGKDILKTSYFWSQRRLRLTSNGTRDDLFLRRPKDVLQEAS